MIWLDVAIAIFAGGLVIALATLRGVAADWVVQAATFALVAVAGVLGGLVFPLAAVIVLQGHGAGKGGWHGHPMLGDHEQVQAHGHATARDHATRPSACAADQETGRAAASVDAADNAGACLGAFVTGALLVPILGAGGACLAVAGVKVLSAALLVAARRP
jgi:hypothetical protein